jgi:Zn finger protein HypA/HybF involved in hydrogenase expression
MHETSLIQEMLEVVARVQRENHQQPVVSLKVEISEFGGWDPEHFREHFSEAVAGSAWQDVRLDIVCVPIGPEARLSQVTFQP